MRINMKKSMLIVAICAVLVCAVTAVTFAAWSNKLEPTKEFEITAGSVTHLVFGGADGVVISDKLEPGKTVSVRVMLKSTADTINVAFSVLSVQVKLSGETEFSDLSESDKDLLVMETITNKTITSTGANVEFKFKMKQNVDYKYALAVFKITVKAVGSIAV